MNLDSTVVVRNLRPGPAVLDNPDDARKYYSWGGSGAPDGSDVIRIPFDVAQSHEFLNAERLGVFKIVDAASAQADLDRQVQVKKDAREAKVIDAREAIDPSGNRNINSTSCVGPDARGNSDKCGQQVIVRPDVAPLCTKHAGLASQYTQTETWENEQKVVKWSRAVLER